MDILNFISWIKAGKYSPTMPANAITVVGVPNPTRGDAYLPVTVPVTAFGGSTGSNIGRLIGGGIVVAEWNESGVAKALVASLTNLSVGLQWTLPAYQSTSTFSSASASNGFSNTNGIITQTTAPAAITYAAGLASLHNGGSFTDWYLPAIFELALCYNSAAIVNKVLGDVNGFILSSYWSSTEFSSTNALSFNFLTNAAISTAKSSTWYVRAVRIHNL